MKYKILTKEESYEVMEIAEQLHYDIDITPIDAENMSVGLKKREWQEVKQIQRMRSSYQIR